MRFGVCSELNRVEIIKGVGFDYIEPSLTKMYEMTDLELKENIEKLKELDIKAEACNHFFYNKKHVLIGENITPTDEMSEYLKRAFYNFKCLGGEIAVCGSGEARSYPDGFSKEKGFEQFYSLLSFAGDIAKENDITIAIEPLKVGETNIVNTAIDGLQAVKAINHSNVKMLVDLYHFFMNKEEYETIEKLDKALCHVHISNPIKGECDRHYPKLSDDFDQTPFVNALKKCGYDMRVSIEAGTKNFEVDAKEGLEALKVLF